MPRKQVKAFAELLKSGPLTISVHDYGGFEKAGSFGTLLPRNDEQITTSAGDIILHQGNQITVYYAQNSWAFTRPGRVDAPDGLRKALGEGDVEITFQLAGSTASESVLHPWFSHRGGRSIFLQCMFRPERLSHTAQISRRSMQRVRKPFPNSFCVFAMVFAPFRLLSDTL